MQPAGIAARAVAGVEVSLPTHAPMVGCQSVCVRERVVQMISELGGSDILIDHNYQVLSRAKLSVLIDHFKSTQSPEFSLVSSA